MHYTLFYRSYIRGCNYSCYYCPFSKEIISKEILKKDKDYLFRFLKHIRDDNKKYNLFFAPRGEILNHDYYRDALAGASHYSNIGEIVIQTNLSSSIEWIRTADLNKLILWATYHPSQVSKKDFFSQVKILMENKVRFTVGSVGVKRYFKELQEMHEQLQTLGKDKPYFWINAFKDQKNYYSKEDIEFLKSIDPLFEINLRNYISKDVECLSGYGSFFIEYNGMIHRCWQDKKRLGNILTTDLDEIKSKKRCTKDSCTCFIGYNQIKELQLKNIYKNSLIGRLP